MRLACGLARLERRAVGGLAVGMLALPGLAAAAEGPRPTTVFINYEGARLRGGDDSSHDGLSCINGELDYPAFFGSEAVADQVTEQVRGLFEPYAVRVVDERPPEHLPYTMVMVGALPQDLGLDNGVGGYACVIDCGDALARETVLVFGGSIEEPRELAQTIVHEVAHSWGLDHVAASELIMNPTTSGAERMLGEGCTALDEPASAKCNEQHAMFCAEPGMQDSVAEILALRGPAAPDLVPPVIELRSPVDGTRVWPGELVRVEAIVEDDHPDFGWRWVVPELSWSQRGSDDALELRFPAGEYTVRVEAIDQAGNEASAELTLMVGEAEASDSGEGDSSDTGGDGGSEDGADSASANGTELDDGCRIGTDGSPRAGLVLLLLAWIRRRRRAKAA
ncbi:hypothetical protein [Paraliomyxa miuraensis]|uniref:hypothetical protein n=1 Tax=Paraliomyxa miuraensis TaxID=376150 RepID=UPI00224F1C57|nr:hypothetical protein [Paraliomyxa miuraensis]MCX4242088.1 hypothetical protein [Paraliomyxa miuraensis]